MAHSPSLATEKSPPTLELASRPQSIRNGPLAYADSVRPDGWMYKNIKIGPFELPYYASPKTQLLLVAFTCFLCPGECKQA